MHPSPWPFCPECWDYPPPAPVVTASSGLDCGDNSCRYARNLAGQRTNGGCRCDLCPTCGAVINPFRPKLHYARCSDQGWRPVTWMKFDRWGNPLEGKE